MRGSKRLRHAALLALALALPLGLGACQSGTSSEDVLGSAADGQPDPKLPLSRRPGRRNRAKASARGRSRCRCSCPCRRAGPPAIEAARCATRPHSPWPILATTF